MGAVTMRVYETLLKLGCFHLSEATVLFGNVKTAKSAIYSLKKRGLAQSVKRNLYVLISMETGAPVVSHYEIASHITESAYVSHHSAFEYYGMANQVFNEIYVSSKERFNDFEFDGRVYKYVASKLDTGINVTGLFKVTDLERTVIDNIKDFSKIGGLEETLRCLSMVTVINENNLLNYIKAYNNMFLYQKAGYILSHFSKSANISEMFFKECMEHINKSVRYLHPDITNKNCVLNKDWQLCVPPNLMHLIGEGRDIDV
jgi:predicted transcriptional regulator of viral defense system